MAPPSPSRTLLVATGLALVGLLACVVSVVGLLCPAPVTTPVAPAAFARQAPAPVVAPAAVWATDPSVAVALRSWDDARAQAWARGDPVGLRRLYVPGAAAGEADVVMLRAWTSRGLVVEGLTTQLLALSVLDQGPDRLRLRVTDRLSGGVAVARDGTRTPLPADGASTRVVTLQRHAGSWRVASVRTPR